MREETRNFTRSNRRSKAEQMRRSGAIVNLMGLVVVLTLGWVVYLKIWSIDSDFTQQDGELIRRQFDLANKEAMDESAEWRYKYDAEFDRATTCVGQLSQVKEALQKKVEEVDSINKNLAILQKENMGLLDQVKNLTKELQTEKSKCNV